MESGLPSLILWMFSLVAAICAGALGAILAYHWFAFGSNIKVAIAAVLIYALGSLGLVVALVSLSIAV